LRRQQKRQQAWEIIGRGWPDHDLVFTYEDSRPVHPDALSDSFKRMVKPSGLRRIRLHDCHHTYATLALENNVPIKVISEVLGHSSPAFTMDVYSHVTPTMMEDLAGSVRFWRSPWFAVPKTTEPRKPLKSDPSGLSLTFLPEPSSDGKSLSTRNEQWLTRTI